MDSSTFAPSPYFDPAALRVELTGLFNAHGASDARGLVVDRLKALVKDARLQAQRTLEADGNGRRCAEGLAKFQDELIRLIYDYTVHHVYRASIPSEAERMAIVATGGYGRGLLAPGSDIDLLFLLPYRQTPWGESVAEYMLYVLWDLGFKVGHATRNVDQCLKMALADMTIRTALVDIWLVQGDAQLFSELSDRLRADVFTGTGRKFIDAKMAEREERHKKMGESRYKVEPNVKDGKGGLRDLHALHWLSKYLFGGEVGPPTVEAGIFTPAEVATFRKCEDFLWSVRCLLHFTTGRAEERLTFDLQPHMAEVLGYRAQRGQLAVERFMKHYFLIAKEVGDLTTILCSALEIQQLKTSPGLKSRLLAPLGWRSRRQLRERTDFRIDNGRLNIADRDVFQRDPVNLIRLFAQAEAHDAFLHPDAIRRIRRSLRLIDDKFRQNPEANRIFLEMLTGRTNPEASLRRMNEAGVIGRFIPPFGHVVGMTQFNMYHHYTVDEHLIRTVGQLNYIERGEGGEQLPLSSEIFPTIKNRKLLYVTAFLHDIGKGRVEDHSILGARIAREVCPQLGLTPAETDTVCWLIEHHLTMSTIAQTRDIADPKTVRQFADIVQSPERLKLLLLLTVADIRAVGPGVWNGWKGQLLRTLYYETEPLVAGGHTKIERRERVAEAKSAFRAALPDWPDDAIARYTNRYFPDYWLRTDTARQVQHAKLIERAEASGENVGTEFTMDAFAAITEVTVYAPNHPRLLALFAGACAANGANIMGAHITTTRDGSALDTFLFSRGFTNDEDEERRARRIGDTMIKLLKGEEVAKTMLANMRVSPSRIDAFKVEPEVIINNALSDSFTVIEVSGRDRTGLLYDLTSTLSDLSLDISSAHITTYGEKAVDVFYVTDLLNKKIESEARQKTITDRLEVVLGGHATNVAGKNPGNKQPA
ncbi:MAG: [protein-PII] uridylyltransferase [Hyphomicrobiaceae bacterium]|nr:[protein-PII] uridylyltransferase [Hyphomicrobiaceae bacterium]